MILLNGKPDNRISISDRGLQYGDGVFETIAYRDGQAEFLEAHLTRLNLACSRLAIPFQQQEILRTELDVILDTLADTNSIIKIIISRGSGGRGYLADRSIEPTRIISTHSLPTYPNNYQETGITARFCQRRLSENASLAGIKHLNRLEQVLARNEWSDSAIAEGIMLDQHDNIIEGTMSNLFIVKSGKLLTAKLDKSGVAGIVRAEILHLAMTHDIPSEQCQITKALLSDADEVFLCNSIIGIWPVRHIIDINTDYQYSIGTITSQLQQLLMRSLVK